VCLCLRVCVRVCKCVRVRVRECVCGKQRERIYSDATIQKTPMLQGEFFDNGIVIREYQNQELENSFHVNEALRMKRDQHITRVYSDAHSCTATHLNALQHTATHYNALQHIATQFNTL